MNCRFNKACKFTTSHSIRLYRKITSDRIFSNGGFLPDKTVLVFDQNGVLIDLVDEVDGGDDIQHFNGMLCPGFINTHCHLELSYLKGRIEKMTGLKQFVMSVMGNREEEQDLIEQAIMDAESEMIANGIIAVGDICNTANTLKQKRKNKLYYHSFIELSGFVPASAEARFLKGQDLLHEFRQAHQAATLVPHAPYSVSADLLKMICGYEAEGILTMHNQESKEETDFFQNRTGEFLDLYQQLGIDISFFEPQKTSSLQQTIASFPSARKLILVHNVFTEPKDLFMADAQFSQHPNHLYYCLCPNANAYITGEEPPIKMFQNCQVQLVLGTDSLASNDSLNIWEEIKTIRKNHPEIPLTEMLTWATINGARALGVEHRFGSFEKGKTPGFYHITDQV
ncbi:MAG: hypothetical protein RL582_1267 [Bacteroidota bacterium]